jgi:hypothetical protein
VIIAPELGVRRPDASVLAYVVASLWRGSTLDRFLAAVPDAAVQVVPTNDA